MIPAPASKRANSGIPALPPRFLSGRERPGKRRPEGKDRMRKLVVCSLAAIVLSACSVTAPRQTQAQLVERGEYLVTAIGGCNDCHTPMTPNGPDMSHSLQGAELVVEPRMAMPWAPYAPAIAGGPANYTDEQFVAFLQTGVRPDGSRARPPMPQFRLNEEDARAVAAYIKTLPRGGG